MAGGSPVTYGQFGFRFRNDEGDNNDDTGWMAAKNTGVSLVASDSTKFRLRFLVNRVQRNNSNNAYMGLYYSLNEGVWTYLDNSDEIFQSDPIMYAVESDVAGYTAGSDTTPLLGGTAPVEHTDNNGIVERTQGSNTPLSAWPPDNFEGNGDSQAEFEWCLILREGFVSVGDSIELRVYFNDAAFDDNTGSYDELAFITVTEPVVPRTIRRLIIIQ